MNHKDKSGLEFKLLITKSLKKFEGVSAVVDAKSVFQIRSNKLFNEYSEAIRLAKIILKHFDYSINKTHLSSNKVTPFVLDMSLLYEHYVYGLLHEAYTDKIVYQFKGKIGIPDFLYKPASNKAILDTKYIPRYETESSIDIYVVKQLLGYSRDLKILRKGLGYEDIDENSPIPSVPCIIIYPIEGNRTYDNPFIGTHFKDIWKPIKGYVQLYKIYVPLPTLNNSK